MDCCVGLVASSVDKETFCGQITHKDYKRKSRSEVPLALKRPYQRRNMFYYKKHSEPAKNLNDKRPFQSSQSSATRKDKARNESRFCTAKLNTEFSQKQPPTTENDHGGRERPRSPNKGD